MAIQKTVPAWIILILTLNISNFSFSQTQISGKVVDAKNQTPVAYVNIGIKEKNIGTVSREDGSFKLELPLDYQSDTLTFSMVGYHEFSVLIGRLPQEKEATIVLKEKSTKLKEVIVTAERPVEKKYGIKKRGAIHFTDGIFKKEDSFEIGQVIYLGKSLAQITSLFLHVNSSRPDSANFRINFYRYDTDENTPKERICEKSILQRHPVKEGWLKFDLREYNVLLKGNVLASLEFIPEPEKDVKQIFYEVKIGGSSKSFFRKTSLGRWTRPPHHYCLYVTAITDKSAPDEPEDEETRPSVNLKSDFSDEPFSIFVRLPRSYSKSINQTYPVVYLLDGNVYFDAIANSVASYSKRKKIAVEPIVVGIGYENAYVMDSLRNRDYTFPPALPADSFKVSGRGDKFYNFVAKNVVKYVDSTFRTDKANRTIMGHSLGGYFVLYALGRQFTEPMVFRNFVAASPSTFYHDNHLIKEFISSPPYQRNREELKLYLTIGELEVSENQSNEFKKLSNTLKDKAINVKTEVYKDLEHMETAIPTFENGMLLMMGEYKLRK